MILIIFICIFLLSSYVQVKNCVGNPTHNNDTNMMQFPARILSSINVTSDCDGSIADNLLFRRYFNGVLSMYRNDNFQPLNYIENTCIPTHHRCGWPTIEPKLKKQLPLYVLSVGLEG